MQKRSSMSIIAMLIIGLICGALARLLVPGRDPMGLLLTMVLGIVGSFVAGFLGHALGWYQMGEGPGFVASLFGAVLVLIVARAVMHRST
jgi:uncharacterized membrane protein YeaQ/YmgE (transglycosylase-associated protein family)